MLVVAAPVMFDYSCSFLSFPAASAWHSSIRTDFRLVGQHWQWLFVLSVFRKPPDYDWHILMAAYWIHNKRSLGHADKQF
ncbi:hypothetical protein [Nitrosomonas communis]|uniref:hypothetical protein n=1 Tax=Nitrosomonas communis TaxID=44574 RepID=UPI0026EC1F50|nr:hypothetical protein [Nitrosomonas communis]MCO6427379.1 hypothetical protein [Nitrosomonas communis]